MQWSVDRNGGFSRAEFAQLYFPTSMDPVYGYQSVNVEAQQRTSTSLLQAVRSMIALRQRHPVFGRGQLEFLDPENKKALAFIRTDDAETVLCVYNLSRTSQAVSLDLSAYEGMIPVDMQYRVPFPAITAQAYQMTFNEYGFYWLILTGSG
jgi:maltose alpha-D-glucosyltransferase / alpha-amylase